MKNIFAGLRPVTGLKQSKSGQGRFNLKSMLTTRLFWILLVILVILISGGYYAYTAYFKPTTTLPQETGVQTAVARRGTLVVSASAAGKVVPATQISLGFDEGGTLSGLLVKAGDQVQTGQVLARLQTNQTNEDIALAQADARLNVLTAQQALDAIYSNSQLDAAQALKDVEDLQQALDDLQNSDLRQAEAAQAVAQAEEAVRTAQRVYNGARSPADQNTVAQAYAELVLAQSALKDMQAKFDDYVKKPDDDLEKASVQLKLSSLQQAYNSALSYYNAVTGTGSDLELQQTSADLEAAQAEFAQAQRDWDRVKEGPSPGELALAEAQLAVARAKYETLKNGADPAEIARAQAELANANAKLAVAEEDQANIELLAPQDGTILSISSSVGESISAGALMTLANLSRPRLEIYLDESDLDKASVGYEAEVVFDSLPDDTYIGHIIEVQPSLETVSNISTVVAQVELDGDSYAKPQSLPVGSNATVEVIGGRAENAVLIPVEALREIAPGEFVVFVQEDGKLRLRVVTVGLMDFTSAQILSGLEAGETVTTGLVETTQSGS
jgi:HlyD family secretion protein